MLLLLFACNDPDRGPKGSEDLDVTGLVPLPALVEDGEGSFDLVGATVSAGDAADAPADFLADTLGLRRGSGGAVELRIEAGMADEAYTLDVTEDSVRIAASTQTGLFWGVQTLRQLLPPASLVDATDAKTLPVPVVRIEDSPRFAWRGYMLDVARHFFEPDEVKRQIDAMALHKLNVLHLHLTDDQGWRIEIRSWPKLTSVGGATEVGGGPGGWYTQAEYADIVAYAAARHITVVPEIDLPGHAHAAVAAYPELYDGPAPDPYTGAGVISTPLWLDSPSTPEFVTDVWSEVAALTPGEWVHIGGDEAVDIDLPEYAAFVQWMQAVVRNEGKTAIGWDEVADATLDAPYAAQHWFSEYNARKAVSLGGRVIASPAEHTYLDMVHDTDAEFGQTWAGPVNVQAAYDWEPVLDGLDESDYLGVEGALWTEYVGTEAQVDLMTWPRLAALAEVAWTPAEKRGWRRFSNRLGFHGARLEALGLGYYASPELEWDTLE